MATLSSTRKLHPPKVRGDPLISPNILPQPLDLDPALWEVKHLLEELDPLLDPPSVHLAQRPKVEEDFLDGELTGHAKQLWAKKGKKEKILL